MPSLLSLPPELLLTIFEAVTDLRGLANFLRSSPALQKLSSTHLSALLRQTLIPRFTSPAHTDAVLDALRAASAKDALLCYYSPDPHGRPAYFSHPLTTGPYSKGFTGDPSAVLLQLRDLAQETAQFAKDFCKYCDIPSSHCEQVTKLLWRMQAFTLRRARFQGIDFRDTVPSPLPTARKVIDEVTARWERAYSRDTGWLMREARRFVGDTVEHLHAHLLCPPRSSLLFRLHYGRVADSLKLSGEAAGLSEAGLLERVISASGYQQRREALAAWWEKEYRGFRRRLYKFPNDIRDLLLSHEELDRAGVRLETVRQDVRAWLEWTRGSMFASSAEEVDLVGLVGRDFSNAILEAPEKGMGTLQKHLRIVARANGLCEPMEDVEDILPDVQGCFDRALTGWYAQRRVERRHGIGLRPGLSWELEKRHGEWLLDQDL